MHFHVAEESYKTESEVELTVREKNINVSGEDYQVLDPNGDVLFKMDGHALSVRDKCVLKNHHGHAILVARKKFISMHERWEACKGEHFDDDKVIFYVQKANVVHLKTHLKVFFAGNEDHDAPDFEIKGNFFEREGQIFHGDEVVAEIKRKFSAGNVILDKHTFGVVVSPGVDQAFIAALIIIMDRIHDD